MSLRKRKTSGSSFAGRAAGLESAAFGRALRSVYDSAVGKSSPREPVSFNRRTVGHVVREGRELIFERYARQEHLMRVLGAWGMHRELVDLLRRMGVTSVRVFAYDGVTECAPLTAYEQGIERSFGSGVQLFLPRKKHTRIDRSSTPQLALGV